MSDQQLQILGFGAISVDRLIYVDQPLSSEKGKVERYLTSHGGNVATALVAAAQLGVASGFIGWLSSAAEHKACLDELETQGVDITRAPRSQKAAPIYSTITVGNDGGRFIAYDDDVLHGTDPNLPDSIFSNAKILIIDGYATDSIEFIARARKNGLQVVSDIEWTIGKKTDSLMAMSDHLVLPWEFAEKITQKCNAPEILKSLWSPERSSVVVTNGAKGTFVLTKEREGIWHIPAYDVDVVDTTGAGDCFHGAFAAALVKNKPAIQSAIYASAAAAISTTGAGGRGALPTHQACIDLIRDQQREPMELKLGE